MFAVALVMRVMAIPAAATRVPPSRWRCPVVESESAREYCVSIRTRHPHRKFPHRVASGNNRDARCHTHLAVGVKS